jgi:Fe-S cluster biogenesis protein NfuA
MFILQTVFAIQGNHPMLWMDGGQATNKTSKTGIQGNHPMLWMDGGQATNKTSKTG